MRKEFDMEKILITAIVIALAVSIFSNINKIMLVKQSYHSDTLKKFAALPANRNNEKIQLYKQFVLIAFKLSGIVAITIFLLRGGL